MALIRCPECKQPMSSTLKACPHCGYVVSDEEKIKALEEAVDNPVSFPKPVVKQQSQPSLPQSTGTIKIGNRKTRTGQFKIQGGALYYKNLDFNWPMFWIGFFFLTLIGAFILGAVVPHSWEIVLYQSIIGKIDKENHDFGGGEKKTFAIITKKGTKILFAPELYDQWEAFFDSLDLEEYIEEKTEESAAKTEEIEEELRQFEENEPTNNEKAAIVLIIMGIVFLIIIIVTVMLSLHAAGII